MGEEMSVLTITDLESHQQDTLLFPAINLSIDQAHVTAIYANLNVRQVLLDIITGRGSTGNGSIHVNGIAPNNKNAYKKEISVLYFKDDLYNSLSVKHHLKFY